jgi:hypothetical protein
VETLSSSVMRQVLYPDEMEQVPRESGAPGQHSDYEPYFFIMVQSIHARGVVATRLLDLDDDVPDLYGLVDL